MYIETDAACNEGKKTAIATFQDLEPLYSMARGEILGFMEDKLMRKHLSRMFSLIKNES